MLQFMRLRDVTFLFLFASTQLVKSSASQKTRYLSRVPPHLSLSLVNYDTGIDRTPESVRNMLNHNLYKVLSGKRAREFAESYSKATDAFSGAYTNIVSTHGRSTNLKTKDGDEEVKQHIIEVLSELEKQFQLPPPSFFTLCARATRLGWNFAPCIATCGLAYMSSAFRTGVWYRILTHCIAKSGPAFIKWGQWASTRTDMFDEQLCSYLATLHSNAPAHSWACTQTTVEEALGLSPGTLFEVFDSFDTKPLASGSIAQIHKAVLKPPAPHQGHHISSLPSSTGIAIAVKVRHPMVAEMIDWDFRIMLRIADVVDSISALKWLNVRSSVEQFSHTMAAQAHLDIEAHHLEVLNYNFRRWKTVGFPRPCYATNSIICETFEKGEVITAIIDQYENEAQRLGRPGYELIPRNLAKFLVTNGLSVYMKMLLVDNLMHADLHPGNIMVCMNRHRLESKKLKWETRLKKEHNSDNSGKPLNDPKNVKKEQLNMILVDAGMVAQLDKDECNNFIGFLASLGKGDGRLAAEKLMRFSSSSDDYILTDQMKEEFTRDMVALFSKLCRGYGTNVEIGVLLREILQLIRIHRVRIAANYATLVINVLCIESLATRVAPDYNLLDAARPLLESYDNICASNGGSIQQSPLRHTAMRWWMSLMYVKKATADTIFFWKQDIRNAKSRTMLRKSAFVFGIDLVLVTTVVACAIRASGGHFDLNMLSSLVLRRRVRGETSTQKD